MILVQSVVEGLGEASDDLEFRARIRFKGESCPSLLDFIGRFNLDSISWTLRFEYTPVLDEARNEECLERTLQYSLSVQGRRPVKLGKTRVYELIKTLDAYCTWWETRHMR